MTTPVSQSGATPRRLWRSTGAVFLGFFTVFVLSMVTDQVLHMLKVFPPWGQPSYDTGLFLLATGYRLVFTVIGGYVTARFAPHAPMRHAVILGVVGTFLALAAAIATIPLNLGPVWYPIALVVTALPFTWLGGALYQKRHAPLTSST